MIETPSTPSHIGQAFSRFSENQSMTRIVVLTALLVLVSCTPAPAAASCGLPCSIDGVLGPKLSQSASIVHSSLAAPRWSEYNAPAPGTIVNVGTEEDVQTVVQYCNAHNISFLAQGGGNGWGDTFTLDNRGLLINLRGIRNIEFNPEKTIVAVQGGTIIRELIATAYGNSTQVSTGNCNCIGVLGSTLGGGYGRLMGLYGMSVDNLLSMNVVTAGGDAITVTPQGNQDLWWALRGAGANFGIVTSATMRAYPVPQAQNGAWLGPLIFTPDRIPALVTAINGLILTRRMSIFMYFTTAGPPDYMPVVIAIPFYLGPAIKGEAAFASIFAVGPVSNMTAFTPYNQFNEGSESFCVPGGRKPSYAAGLEKLDPQTWVAVFNKYVDFLKTPGVQNSTVLMEYYPSPRVEAFGVASSSYAFRSSIKMNAVVNTAYVERSLDPVAESFGSSVRDLWRSSSGLPQNDTYINYANGDEPLISIYGDNVPRLQQLKQQHDPSNRFNQWFPLC